MPHENVAAPAKFRFLRDGTRAADIFQPIIVVSALGSACSGGEAWPRQNDRVK